MSDVVQQRVRHGLKLHCRAQGRTEPQRLCVQRRHLARHYGGKLSVRPNRRLYHGRARLGSFAARGIDLLASLHWRLRVRQKRAPLQGAAKLAARHNFLPRVATFLEVDPPHRLVIEHLGYKSFHGGRGNHGDTAADLAIQPIRCCKGARFGRRFAGWRKPQCACDAVCRIQENQVRRAKVQLAPRCACYTRDLGHGCPGETTQLESIACIAQFGFGTHYKHGKAFECGGQQVTAADQQDFAMAAFETNEAGQHTAFGGAECRQPGFGQTQQREVLGKLRMQELCRFLTLNPHHAQMRHLGDAIQYSVHGVNYHRPTISKFNQGCKVVRRFVVVLLILATALAGAGAWWLDQPLAMDTASVDVAIEPGTSAQGVAELVSRSGIRVRPELLHAWFRLSGDARQIKAGSYEVERGATPRSLLRKLVQGEEALRTVTLVEGWTFRQVREALSRAPQLAPESAGMSEQALMEKLGQPGLHPEGRFFPDTYSYTKGSADLKLLARAMRAMDRQLESAWAARAADTPLQSAEQALVLGSIVEKETGRAGDRPMIAGVFSNRLRNGMLLQTDPSVIYGLGASFDGNLRKKDLQTDTPWNT